MAAEYGELITVDMDSELRNHFYDAKQNGERYLVKFQPFDNDGNFYAPHTVQIKAEQDILPRIKKAYEADKYARGIIIQAIYDAQGRLPHSDKGPLPQAQLSHDVQKEIDAFICEHEDRLARRLNMAEFKKPLFTKIFGF